MGLFSSIAGFIGAGKQKKAAGQAAAAQQQAAQQGINAVSNQNSITQQQLSPFIAPGQQATSAIAQLLGLGATPAGAADPNAVWRNYLEDNPDVAAQAAKEGADPLAYAKLHYETFGPSQPWRQLRQPEAAADPTSTTDQQASAIAALKGSPLFQMLYDTGEESVLQNASATGGLRGGNTQRSLANFGSDTLAKVIQQQLANLGGLSSQGLSAAGTAGQLGAGAAGTIADLFGQQGAAKAGGILGKANASNAQLGNLATGLEAAIGSFMPSPVPGGAGGSGGGIMQSIAKLF